MASVLRRTASTVARATRPTGDIGDISSVFPSLSGKKADALPQRFADLKLHYLNQNQDAIQKSWTRLLSSLHEEVEEVKETGSFVSIYADRFHDPRLLTVRSSSRKSSFRTLYLPLRPTQLLTRSVDVEQLSSVT